MKQQQIKIDLFDSGTISATLSSPDERLNTQIESTLVVMIHDFPFGHSRDHDDLFGHVRNIFDGQGYQTLIFDFQHCGIKNKTLEKFSLESARQNLKEILVWAEKRGFERFIFVGAGMAAIPCLEFVNEKVTMLFLFWPVIDLPAYGQNLSGEKIGQDFIEQMASYNYNRLLKPLKIPVLIQYGAQDGIVGAEHTDIIKDGIKAPRIDVTSYADGGHGLTDPRHRKMISHHLGSFLEKYS